MKYRLLNITQQVTAPDGTKLYSVPKLVQLLENTGNQKYIDMILLRMDPKCFIEPENEITEDSRDLL